MARMILSFRTVFPKEKVTPLLGCFPKCQGTWKKRLLKPRWQRPWRDTPRHFWIWDLGSNPQKWRWFTAQDSNCWGHANKSNLDTTYLATHPTNLEKQYDTIFFAVNTVCWFVLFEEKTFFPNESKDWRPIESNEMIPEIGQSNQHGQQVVPCFAASFWAKTAAGHRRWRDC